jgi:hypothetical protein
LFGRRVFGTGVVAGFGSTVIGDRGRIRALFGLVAAGFTVGTIAYGFAVIGVDLKSNLHCARADSLPDCAG